MELIRLKQKFVFIEIITLINIILKKTPIEEKYLFLQ